METLQQAHLFSEHLLKVHNQAALIRPGDQEQVQISVYLMAVFVLLTLVSANWSQAIPRVLQLGIHSPLTRKFERKERSRLEYSSFLLSALFLFNTGFLAFSINRSYAMILADEGFGLQILFFLLLAAFLVSMRWLLDQVVLAVSNRSKVLQEYRMFSWNINRSAGILLLPIVVLTAFSGYNPAFLNTLGLVVLSALLLFRWTRAVLLCMGEEGIGILQILTYFCGLEILPQLVTVKFLVETF